MSSRSLKIDPQKRYSQLLSYFVVHQNWHLDEILCFSIKNNKHSDDENDPDIEELVAQGVPALAL